MAKKLSIITVNLNDVVGLQKTIDSVLKQTCDDFEFIVIDGASTDGSAELLKKYDSSIDFWVSEPDTGIFNAMNKGIKKATGDYCHFLNAGDCFYTKDVVETVFGERCFTEPFICGHQINDFGDHQSKADYPTPPLTMYDFFFGTIKHQATFIRRDLFDTYGLYDEGMRITADWKFFFETIGLHNEQPVFVDVNIVLFAWYGMSANYEPKHIARHQEERRVVLDKYLSLPIQSDYNQMRTLKNYEYIADAMEGNKFFSFFVRTLVKIFRTKG